MDSMLPPACQVPAARPDRKADKIGPKMQVFRLTWSGCLPIKRPRFVACRRFNEYLKPAQQVAGIGRVSRVAKGADCKSAGLRLRRFESYLSHQHKISTCAHHRGLCGRSLMSPMSLMFPLRTGSYRAIMG